MDATDVSKKYDGTAYGVSASANVPAGTTIRYSETYSTNPADYTLTTSPTATHVDDSATVYFVSRLTVTTRPLSAARISRSRRAKSR